MKNFRSYCRNAYAIGLTIFVLQNIVAPAPVMAQEFLFGFSGGIVDNSLTLGLASGETVSLNVATIPNIEIPRQGWWSGASNFINSFPNTSYICGDLSRNGTIILNNFFTFDISGLQGQMVTFAQFNVLTAGRITNSGRRFHTYWIFDVSTPIELLNSTQGFNAAIHLDLASGVNYGNFDIPMGGPLSRNPHLTLNSHAITDINNAISGGNQFFSIGGTLFPVILDSDGDSVPDDEDNCPEVPNPDQEDADEDGLGDVCDDCPLDPDNDLDGDGVCGDEDCQPDSDLSPTININGCITGVANVLFNDGCTMSDLIAQCAEEAPNHGAFVSCVTRLTNEWKQSGLITEQEKGQIQSCAAQADIPGDLDGNGIVNVTDLLQVLAAWGFNPGHAADFNDDGMVNVTDLLKLLANWG